MDVSLVTDAYNDMMGRHGQELSESTTSVYIHSDYDAESVMPQGARSRRSAESDAA
jgi:hypothetical protein